jgi:hypothetical protein
VKNVGYVEIISRTGGSKGKGLSIVTCISEFTRADVVTTFRWLVSRLLVGIQALGKRPIDMIFLSRPIGKSLSK